MSISYNIGARYEIIGRISKGTTVVAYMLKDKVDNTVGKMEKCIVEQLALNKQIYNCTGQVYNNIVNLKGINCKLSKLPKYNDNGNIIEATTTRRKMIADLEIIGRINQGRIVSDYIIVPISDTSKKMKVPRDMVLKLVQDGRIVNARYQMNNNEIILRGDGVNLSQLQTYEDY